MDKVVPRIHVDYSDPIYARDDATGLRGQGPALALEGDAAPFLVPMIADLMLAFAFDRGSHYEILNREVVRTEFPKLTAPELVELAYGNMWDEISERVELRGDSSIYQGIICGGNFEACLLFFAPIWDNITAAAGGPILTAVPARDLLMVCRADNAKGLAQLKATCSRMIADPKTQGRLSRSIFAHRGGGAFERVDVIA